jgi:hypothetical protein
MFQGYKHVRWIIAYQNIKCHFAANILKRNNIYLLMAFGFFSKIGNNREQELWYPELR